MDLDFLSVLKKRMLAIGDVSIYVGIPEKTNSKRGTNINQANLAAIHEFGVPGKNIPQRSFLTSAMMRNKRVCSLAMARQIKLIAIGKTSVKSGLGVVGFKVKGLVINQIENGTFVPLKPATIARKKSSRPLIETGALKGSISYEVK